MDFWLYALTSVDLGLMYDSHYTVDAFRDALLENNVIDINSAYTNLTGSVPPMISEFIGAHPNMRRADLAEYISRVRYNHHKIKNRPVHCYQIVSLASKLINSETVPTEHRRTNYVHTRQKLIEQGIVPSKASAFAFEIHRSGVSRTEHMEDVEIKESVDVDLPNAYMGIDTHGTLYVIDSVKGAYQIETYPCLPTQWVVRISPDVNEFLVGDDTRCVHVSLTDGCDSCIQTPLSLPGISSPVSIEFKWVAWGTNQRPHAFKWDGRAVQCSTIDARKLLVSAGEQVCSEGNCVMLGNETIAKLPAGHSIGCVYGGPGAVDVVTTSLDFWRINTRTNTASCVGLPVTSYITCMAPLVGWV